ncbi:DUF484 family protein [Aeromonas schubertii]|uniref:DUF484 family protein n=1 Tax=Aeromonas schubertii TaxID=652 RepID=A0A0S2SNS6_9GAMM|nr:DUF484 family protein [Aeromonas schubertii]ALP43370.1 hypothetical protein WL1483_3951 [Aeromonas schubertii]KUE78552.1 hypothetical protein ATO46_09335 [Aeromonas schubertii]MBZ6065963.1 DUF484 family protein [Aeromonas schubertii]MBZ6072721.1 DUF484 family protein [Aeromonas schubertii]QCG49783.1 DUF484 family protein [Aeromonas schubertii]
MSEPRWQESGIDESQVLEYLSRHPEFFLRHPLLLDRLRIPHDRRGSVSLVELQLGRQRERIDQLEQEITELMQVASQNERLFRCYAEVYAELFACCDLFDLSRLLARAFVQQLRLTSVRLWLNPRQVTLPEGLRLFMADGRQLDALLATRLPGQECYQGRLSQGEKQALFGLDVLVNSVALLRLGDLGILAFASSDPGHFSPHNDTLLLGQLGRLLQLRLPELLRG